MIRIRQKDLADVRRELLEKQSWKCALCGKELKITDAAVDHQHRLRKSQPIGEDGGGLIRGVLCRDCNVLEGKIWNASSRYLRPENLDRRIEWLESLVKYLRTCKTDMVHPTEREPVPKLSKRQYNLLVKTSTEKVPEFPKRMRMTKKLQRLYTKYNIHPYANEKTDFKT